jgi:hypothetical protein
MILKMILTINRAQPSLIFVDGGIWRSYGLRPFDQYEWNGLVNIASSLRLIFKLLSLLLISTSPLKHLYIIPETLV